MEDSCLFSRPLLYPCHSCTFQMCLLSSVSRPWIIPERCMRMTLIYSLSTGLNCFFFVLMILLTIDDHLERFAVSIGISCCIRFGILVCPLYISLLILLPRYLIVLNDLTQLTSWFDSSLWPPILHFKRFLIFVVDWSSLSLICDVLMSRPTKVEKEDILMYAAIALLVLTWVPE